MNPIIFSVLIVLSYCATRTSAAPTHDTVTMELSQVLDNSVCPIKVEIDEDETRVPRLIKTLRCGSKPSAVCVDQKTAHACCRHHHHQFSTQCVEVIDHVLVHYKGKTEPTRYPVPVGCTCMIRKNTPALDAS